MGIQCLLFRCARSREAASDAKHGHAHAFLGRAPGYGGRYDAGVLTLIFLQYDIKSLDKTEGDNADGIENSRDRLLGLIEKEVAGGIPHARIVLGGFSQVGNQWPLEG
jgi:predicted esterase